jgi:hypothetical protein
MTRLSILRLMEMGKKNRARERGGGDEIPDVPVIERNVRNYFAAGDWR